MKSQYLVLSPISHDLVQYDVDSTIELDDKHAEPLLERGDIQRMTTAVPESGALVAAIKAMSTEDPEHAQAGWWDRAGKPTVGELARRVGAPVKAIERDAALAEIG